MIDSIEFGKIVIDGKSYSYDVVIDAEGRVLKRSDVSQTYYGSHHVICTEEIKQLLKTKPQVIVIGTGQYGACRLEQNVEKICKVENVKLIVEPTPKAIKTFNQLKEKKAALFHLTC